MRVISDIIDTDRIIPLHVLFDILQKGDYEKFIELGKQRGMSRNKTNEALRAALKDEVVFHEVCSGGVERSQIVNKIRDL
ncbi:MAG: hypothetical protein IJ099_04585 [Alphaproteobacteria bacterium]|nr:hypothetical protein [Alphaproteobacteria bacterium]